MMKKFVLLALLALPLTGRTQMLTPAQIGDSLVNLGIDCLYRNDTVAALRFFDMAITAGDMDAYANKSFVYVDRDDMKQALKLLRQGAKKGSPLCCNRMGDYHSRLEEYKKAAKYYAKADDPEGWFELGRLWLLGSIGKRSAAELHRGLSLVRRSEQADYRDAIYLMARLFDEGYGVAQNYDSVIYMLNRLEAREDPYGLYALAYYCEQGLGVAQDSARAIDLYRRAGAAGVSDGYSHLADYYRYGLGGMKRDPQAAYETYMLAAGIEENNAIGLAGVADCYLEGIGVRVDTTKAIYYLRDAVEAGSPRAAAKLADMYNYGLGDIEPNGDTALMLYRLASQGDDPRGDYMMGAYLYEQGAYDNAMGFIVSAAQHGSIDALILYAQALLQGNGIDQDAPMAVGILRQTAPTDVTGQAHFVLGIAHYMGLGIPEDKAEAARCFDTAAAKGNSRAMLNLGHLYARGEGVERDTVKAVEWYNRSVEAGYTSAMILLADDYRTGIVAPRDPKRAAELYQMAADRGDVDGLCRLGLCYEQGEGVVLNSRRAYNLYLQAAEKGSVWGMRLVAYCYAQGIYVEQNMAKAVEWFGRAAEAGDMHSAFILGQLYASGEGVKKNKKAAKEWLKMAAEGGVQEAAELLKTL